MGTYVVTQTISPEFREAHFRALKTGSDLPDDIADVVKAHMQYMEDLKGKGKTLLGGPMVSFKWALTILRADSFEEAKSLAENDPSVKSDLLTDIEVEPWFHRV